MHQTDPSAPLITSFNLVSDPSQDPNANPYDNQQAYSIIQNVYQSQDNQNNQDTTTTQDPNYQDPTYQDATATQSSQDSTGNQNSSISQNQAATDPSPDPAVDSVIQQVFDAQKSIDEQAGQPQQKDTPQTNIDTSTENNQASHQTSNVPVADSTQTVNTASVSAPAPVADSVPAPVADSVPAPCR